MTNKEILKLNETLNRLMMNRDLKFNVRVGYLFAKNRALIQQDVQLIGDIRQKILREFGTVQDNGDIVVPKEDFKIVQDKLDDLMNVEIDLPLVQIPVDEFEEIQLPLEDIDGLRPIIMDFAYTSGPIYEEEKTEE